MSLYKTVLSAAGNFLFEKRGGFVQIFGKQKENCFVV